MSGRGEGLARIRAAVVAEAHLAQQRVLVLAGVAMTLFVPVSDVVESGRDGDSEVVGTHLFGGLLYWLAIDPEGIADGGSSMGESVGRGLGLAALVILLVGLGLTVLVVVMSGEDWTERPVRIAGAFAVVALVLGVVGFWAANQLVGSDEYEISTAWGLVVPLVVAALLARLRRDHADLS